MSFEALLDDMDALQKARPPHAEPDADQKGGPSDGDADNAPPERDAPPAKKAPAKKDPGDQKIAAAADGDQDGDGTTDGEDDLAEDDEDDEDPEDDKYFGKSFAVTTATGETVEAYDGTMMMKAFHDRLAVLEQSHDATVVKLEQAETALHKAEQVIADLQKAEAVISKQSELIKSMHGQLAAIQEQGRGRKSALTLHDKPASVPAAPDRSAPGLVLAKAMSAQQAGKITGQDVARIESYLSRGLAVPKELADFII